MASPSFYEDRQAIRKLMDTINQAWLNGPLDQMEATLGECFHENMIIKGPGLRELCRQFLTFAAISRSDSRRIDK